MKIRLYALAVLLLPVALRAQAPITYQLQYAAPGDSTVHISLLLGQPMAGAISLVMPRTYPGGYEQIPYDAYVERVRAFSTDENPLSVQREVDGPRWTIDAKSGPG